MRGAPNQKKRKIYMTIGNNVYEQTEVGWNSKDKWLTDGGCICDRLEAIPLHMVEVKLVEKNSNKEEMDKEGINMGGMTEGNIMRDKITYKGRRDGEWLFGGYPC